MILNLEILDFTSGYVVGTGGSWGQLSAEGTYAITTDPHLVHSNFSSCSDVEQPLRKYAGCKWCNSSEYHCLAGSYYGFSKYEL